ncbi:hypothetical protein D187_009603 [Cystobacter fuscus DSM 2262]|uniref:Uncharacterized protein n=1 Tax=Cystobacter fuscus (strain ATCC 25194 / DSM 2262 / NBRC 100088 / M29) TaxID=1242864 RepID=S9NYM2_CYSF2|nr:hypothetical protein [Cystobacter fuscus]EPX55097.1 hypothetical protein D187_009603 [Cystobacter fuscus DSM 2262]
MFKPGPDTERLSQELESSNSWLFEGQNSRLLSALTAVCPGLKKAFVVDWIPEQGEDIYTVVAGPDLLVVVEVDRLSVAVEPIVEVFSVRDYKKAHPSLTISSRRKLELGLEMLRRLESTTSVD